MKDPVSYELSVFPLEFLSTLHAELAVLVRCSLVRLLAIHSHGQRHMHRLPTAKGQRQANAPIHLLMSVRRWLCGIFAAQVSVCIQLRLSQLCHRQG